MKKLLLLLFLMQVVGLPQYGGGTGTSGDPYQISTPAHLHAVRSNLSAYFIQTANIDLTAATSSGGDYYNSGSGWDPIGTSSSAFTGNFNGQGYTISGMFINRPSTNDVGLFGYTNGATLNNIHLTGANVTGHSNVGILVGRSYFDPLVTGCSSAGTVAGHASAGTNTGGLAGLFDGSLSYNLVVTKCRSTANVSGYQQVGGLFGNNIRGTISKSYATGTVSGNTFVGGFAGFSNWNLINCYATGNVSGSLRVGGFAGHISGGASHANNYSTGTISGSGTDIYGFIGRNEGAYSNCFWDTETSGKATGTTGNTGGITGKTTAQMKTQSTFTDAGWDFTTIWRIADTYYPSLRENENSALPVELVSFSVSTVEGNPMLFWSTATEINNFGFHIEKSNDKFEWAAIEFVNGHGNSNSPKQYSFTDRGYVSGKVYYRLAQMDNDGSVTYSSVIEYSGDKELTFSLNQNFPNPFNPETMIRFSLQEQTPVTLQIYTIAGELIETILNGTELPAGNHIYTFDGSRLNSGIYIYTVSTGAGTISKKMSLLK